MFTGKLSWLGKKRDGRVLDNDDRAKQVDVLLEWIDNKLAAHQDATRVVAMDVNASYDSAPWQRMRRVFGDGGDDRPTIWTFGARRFDGLFWDYDGGAKRSDNVGFLGGPYRSANFGSDHRAVAARIELR
jgi:endonuclease/exonuclease/phosphatase family metal-dependent hydrolase